MEDIQYRRLELGDLENIIIEYEDHHNTVVLTYEDYICGELYSSSTIYIPYEKALKIFTYKK